MFEVWDTVYIVCEKHYLSITGKNELIECVLCERKYQLKYSGLDNICEIVNLNNFEFVWDWNTKYVLCYTPNLLHVNILFWSVRTPPISMGWVRTFYEVLYAQSISIFLLKQTFPRMTKCQMLRDQKMSSE